MVTDAADTPTWEQQSSAQQGGSLLFEMHIVKLVLIQDCESRSKHLAVSNFYAHDFR